MLSTQLINGESVSSYYSIQIQKSSSRASSFASIAVSHQPTVLWKSSNKLLFSFKAFKIFINIIKHYTDRKNICQYNSERCTVYNHIQKKSSIIGRRYIDMFITPKRAKENPGNDLLSHKKNMQYHRRWRT